MADETKEQRRVAKLTLRAIGRAACLSKTQVIIPFKVINADYGKTLLAMFLVGKLKEMGFDVYWRERGKKRKIREYCVTISKDHKIPDGFRQV